MNVLLYNISNHYTPEEITTGRLISEVIDGWQQNKYVFPQQPIKLKHQQHKTYRLM